MTRNGRRRIVFASCNADPWKERVGMVVQRAAEELGAEFVFLGSGQPLPELERCFLDVTTASRLASMTLPQSLTASLDPRAVQSAVADELAYRRARHPIRMPTELEVRRQVLRWTAEAALVLRLIRPDLLIIWNGSFSQQRAFDTAAGHLGVPRIFAEKGMLPNTFYLDARGVCAASEAATWSGSSRGDVDFSRAKLHQYLADLEAAGESGWPQPERGGAVIPDLADGKNIRIFFPAQVDWDANIIKFSPFFGSTAEALRWLVAGLEGTSYSVLAKPHPKGGPSRAELAAIVGKRGIADDGIHVFEAIDSCDCVVTVNSAVAFEAALRGKPVALLGDSVLLSRKGFVSYREGVSSQQLVMEAVQLWTTQRAAIEDELERFTIFLVTEFYAHLDTPDVAVQRLRSFLGGIETIANSRPSVDDLSCLLQPVDLGEAEARFSGREFLSGALRKLAGRVRAIYRHSFKE